jgi:hypothetical protein
MRCNTEPGSKEAKKCCSSASGARTVLHLCAAAVERSSPGGGTEHGDPGALSLPGGVCTAGVSRVWEHTGTIRSFGSVAAVACTSVAHEDGLLLDDMAALSMSSTRVDSVLVVETPADRVAFDDLITHVDKTGREDCSGRER